MYFLHGLSKSMSGESTTREDFRFYGKHQMWTVRGGVSEGVFAFIIYETIDDQRWKIARYLLIVSEYQCDKEMEYDEKEQEIALFSFEGNKCDGN